MADKWLGAHVAGEFDVFIRGQRQISAAVPASDLLGDLSSP